MEGREKKPDSNAEPESITLVGKESGRRLELKRTVDERGVVFYEAPLSWPAKQEPER
jgi:hypothetical protein